MQGIQHRESISKLIRAIGAPPKAIYAPSEDSYLMLDALAQLAVEGRTVLDVGTGSGILGLYCATRGALVTLTDIDEFAVREVLRAAKILGVSVEGFQSDLFSKVHGKFQIVLFNPPYLPSKGIFDQTVDGGRDGATVSSRFLTELADHMDRDGTALLLLSSLNKPESLFAGKSEFVFSIVAQRKIFFEELQVLSIRFRENLGS